MFPAAAALAGAVLGAGALGLASLTGAGEAAPQVVPASTAPPTISGTAAEGSTLTASTGTWSGTAPIEHEFQWRRCDQSGGSCSNISGANERTYQLKAIDVNNTLRVRVTARNRDGSATAESVPTAVVRGQPQPAPTGCPTGTGVIPIDQLQPPARLSVDRLELSPSVATRSTQSLTTRFRITACGGRPVQGALVYVTAVPYNQFSVPSEQQTDGDGWARLDLRRLEGFPASDVQQLLVMFVRARKANEGPLGGVSTRRLVSFDVNLRANG